jgi:nucleotide-binding universal stress UspA family protein
MVFVIPFDGSARTKAALRRAREFASGADESLLAVTAIPGGNASYARQRGWLASDEPYQFDTIVSRLRADVKAVAPEATFEPLQVYRRASGNQIAKPIRKFAKDHDASTVFVGSDNAGRLMTVQSSIGGRICTDQNYDVCIVRDRYQR